MSRSNVTVTIKVVVPTMDPAKALSDYAPKVVEAVAAVQGNVNGDNRVIGISVVGR
jgi:hypothetical protein